MKTVTKVVLGFLGMAIVTAAFLQPAKPPEPSPQAVTSIGRPKLRDDLFGPPAPPTAHGNEPLGAQPVSQGAAWPKDAAGDYEIDIPAGLGSGGLHRVGQQLRRLMQQEREDADAGMAMSVGIYEVWHSGTKDEIVSLVYRPDDVKQLMNTAGWLRAAPENVPDWAGSKTVTNLSAFVDMCGDVLAANEGHEVAGQQFCTR